MRVSILRHAHALAAETKGARADAARPLSAKGRAAMRGLGRELRRSGVLAEATACWHSPLVRARETAEIFCRSARLRIPLREVPGLGPADDPRIMARRLDRWTGGPVILVGHEPHLSALASLLVGGRKAPVLFELKKGALLALESSPERHRGSRLRRWIVRWQLAPEVLKSGGR